MARRPRIALLALAASTAVGAAACGSDEDGRSAPASAPAASGAATAASQRGCDQGGGRLLLDPGPVSPGAALALRVENRTADRVFSFGLSGEVERAAGGAWEPVELPPVPIPEIALLVDPGKTSGRGGGDSIELPANLEPGRYRAVKPVTASPLRGGEPIVGLRLCAAFRVEG